ncbi:MAG TPA: DUF4336 domain-containing protein [Hyphomonadaceae bacterium]|jgi:hypothetical protein|nr:DUF4336 domain-containing protein [Hyphomonadaceae bacterium]
MSLEQFGEDIWLSPGPTITSAGFRYPTRMAVMRLGSGLFIWSPAGSPADTHAELAALGEVRFVVTPNSLHGAFLPDWRKAYRQAAFYAAPGSRKARPDIAFDKDLGEEPDPAWSGEIDQAVMHGNLITGEVVFFHAKSRTVLFTDLIQHFPPGWFKGLQALIARLDGMTGPEPGVPQKFRMAFNNRKAARKSLERILAWPIEKAVMAHAEPVRENGHAFIERAFRWLR